MPAGYSGRSLSAKLGLAEGARILVVGGPEDYRSLLGNIPSGVEFVSRPRSPVDLVHLFVTRRRDLESALARLQDAVRAGGMLWISWPKRASGVPTDLTEDVLREAVLPTGWVDTKVCAVDAAWSGLRFQRRRKS